MHDKLTLTPPPHPTFDTLPVVQAPVQLSLYPSTLTVAMMMAMAMASMVTSTRLDDHPGRLRYALCGIINNVVFTLRRPHIILQLLLYIQPMPQPHRARAYLLHGMNSINHYHNYCRHTKLCTINPLVIAVQIFATRSSRSETQQLWAELLAHLNDTYIIEAIIDTELDRSTVITM
jgi:hypothetical protein